MLRVLFFVVFWGSIANLPAFGADRGGEPRVMRIYWVGHSMARSITPTRLHELVATKGIDLQFGSQLKGGTSLAKNWDYLEKGEVIRYWESNKPVGDRYEPGRADGDTLPKRFGSFWAAHENHDWDALVLLPILIPGDEKEFEAFCKFVDYALEHDSARRIYFFQNWLGRPVLRDAEGRRAGLGDLDYQKVWEFDSKKAGRGKVRLLDATQRDYTNFIERGNQKYDKELPEPIRMIPYGDVVFELDKRLKAGEIPGLVELHGRDPERIPSWDPARGAEAGANILYADRYHPVAAPHMDGTIANYVLGLTYYAVLTGESPIGMSGDAYDLGNPKDEALRRALQTAVWDVVRRHPFTGINPGAKTGIRKSSTRQPAASRSVRVRAKPIAVTPKAPVRVNLKMGSISIAKWNDDKTAAVTIFSSDGMIRSIKSGWTPQNGDVAYDGFYKLGKDYDLRFTFFIPPHGLDRKSYQPTSSVSPPAQPAGTMGNWADWQFMHAQGHEIGSHTYSHVDLRPDVNDPSKTRSGADPDYELSEAIVSIEKNIGMRPISINPAYGPPAGQLLATFRKHYPVVRGDDDGEQILRQHREGATADGLIEGLGLAIEGNMWLLVSGHGIRTELGREAEADPDFLKNGKRRDGYKPVEYEVIEGLCRAIDQRRDELFIGTYGDVGRYVRERDSAEIKIVEQSKERVVLDVTHSLDAEVFDYPLTLKLEFRGTGRSVVVSQDGRSLKVRAEGKQVVFDVAPNGGELIIGVE